VEQTLGFLWLISTGRPGFPERRLLCTRTAIHRVLSVNGAQGIMGRRSAELFRVGAGPAL